MATIRIPRELKLALQEQRRLLETLEYYTWLEDQGLSWDVIRGLACLPNTGINWQRIPKHIRDQHKRGDYTSSGLAGYKLIDGANIVLPWPPYDDNVLFNRRIA